MARALYISEQREQPVPPGVSEIHAYWTQQWGQLGRERQEEFKQRARAGETAPKAARKSKPLALANKARDLFIQHSSPAAKEAEPHLSWREMRGQLQQRWKALPEDQKAAWKRQAAAPTNPSAGASGGAAGGPTAAGRAGEQPKKKKRKLAEVLSEESELWKEADWANVDW